MPRTKKVLNTFKYPHVQSAQNDYDWLLKDEVKDLGREGDVEESLKTLGGIRARRQILLEEMINEYPTEIVYPDNVFSTITHSTGFTPAPGWILPGRRRQKHKKTFLWIRVRPVLKVMSAKHIVRIPAAETWFPIMRRGRRFGTNEKKIKKTLRNKLIFILPNTRRGTNVSKRFLACSKPLPLVPGGREFDVSEQLRLSTRAGENEDEDEEEKGREGAADHAQVSMHKFGQDIYELGGLIPSVDGELEFADIPRMWSTGDHSFMVEVDFTPGRHAETDTECMLRLLFKTIQCMRGPSNMIVRSMTGNLVSVNMGVTGMRFDGKNFAQAAKAIQRKQETDISKYAFCVRLLSHWFSVASKIRLKHQREMRKRGFAGQVWVFGDWHREGDDNPFRKRKDPFTGNRIEDADVNEQNRVNVVEHLGHVQQLLVKHTRFFFLGAVLHDTILQKPENLGFKIDQAKLKTVGFLAMTCEEIDSNFKKDIKEQNIMLKTKAKEFVEKKVSSLRDSLRKAHMANSGGSDQNSLELVRGVFTIYSIVLLKSVLRKSKAMESAYEKCIRSVSCDRKVLKLESWKDLLNILMKSRAKEQDAPEFFRPKQENDAYLGQNANEQYETSVLKCFQLDKENDVTLLQILQRHTRNFAALGVIWCAMHVLNNSITRRRASLDSIWEVELLLRTFRFIHTDAFNAHVRTRSSATKCVQFIIDLCKTVGVDERKRSNRVSILPLRELKYFKAMMARALQTKDPKRKETGESPSSEGVIV